MGMALETDAFGYHVTRLVPFLLVLAALLVACPGPHEQPERERGASTAPARPRAATSAIATRADASSEALKDAQPPEPEPASAPPRSIEQFRQLLSELSEPDRDFFSDNQISNETSYLQVASELEDKAPTGGVYLGVGPEQNFTYIALSRPAEAFIVDIQRDNLILHLLYKAVFEQARTRAEFLTLLLGRPYDEAAPLAPEATVAEVMAHAERLEPSAERFGAIHAELRERIEHGYGIALSARDERTLKRIHRAFFREQLGIRFKLKEQSWRKYPSLGELLAQADPAGLQRGFLARERDFRFVQRLEREHRIVPVVGNFAGDRALAGIARYLRAERRTVSAFYVSNVEQYLLQDGLWWKWVRNVDALPIDDRSLFIRCYLDQGRSHPRQMPGHRTTTLLQPVAHFKARQAKKPYRSMWALATDASAEP